MASNIRALVVGVVAAAVGFAVAAGGVATLREQSRPLEESQRRIGDGATVQLHAAQNGEPAAERDPETQAAIIDHAHGW